MFVKNSIFVVIRFSLSLFGWMLLGCSPHCPKDNRQPIDALVIDYDSTMDAIVFLDDTIIDTTNLHCFAFDENYDRSYKDLLDSLSKEFRRKKITANIVQVAIPRSSTEVFTSTLTTYCVNGETKELNELPYFYRIQSMIDKMLNGDMTDFLFAFDVDYTEHKNTWTLVATPRITAIADMIQNLTMYGSTTDLTKIVMTYDDGTIIILEFKRSKKDFADEIAC